MLSAVSLDKRDPESKQTLPLPDFPVFDEPQRERPRRSMDWSAVQRNFAPLLEFYRRHHDSPEKRLRSKNPEPFRID